MKYTGMLKIRTRAAEKGMSAKVFATAIADGRYML
jgi:hypothetical protein